MIIPHIIECDDNGSIVLEWEKEDRRFCICIEKTPEDSSWHYVDKVNGHIKTMTYGEFSEPFIKHWKMFLEG